MKRIRYIIIPILFLLLLLILNSRMGNFPPIGKFLDPFHGYLALIGSDNINILDKSRMNLYKPVKVVFDTLRIPHIFAQNNHDL